MKRVYWVLYGNDRDQEAKFFDTDLDSAGKYGFEIYEHYTESEKAKSYFVEIHSEVVPVYVNNIDDVLDYVCSVCGGYDVIDLFHKLTKKV